jgi:hypothetical protein
MEVIVKCGLPETDFGWLCRSNRVAAQVESVQTFSRVRVFFTWERVRVLGKTWERRDEKDSLRVFGHLSGAEIYNFSRSSTFRSVDPRKTRSTFSHQRPERSDVSNPWSWWIQGSSGIWLRSFFFFIFLNLSGWGVGSQSAPERARPVIFFWTHSSLTHSQE